MSSEPRNYDNGRQDEALRALRRDIQHVIRKVDKHTTLLISISEQVGFLKGRTLRLSGLVGAVVAGAVALIFKLLFK